MLLELVQEGIGAIEIFQDMPIDLQAFLIPSSFPFVFKGAGIKSLLQEFRGDGFSAWYARYWTSKLAVIKVRAYEPVLELRIALKNILRGTWDKIPHPELAVHSFQMGFVPHIQTRALFDGPKEYQTFDIHFESAFLQALGLDYKTLDKFLNSVDKNTPAELSRVQHPCSGFMLDMVQSILTNTFSERGKSRLLRNNVENILIAALEVVGQDEIKKLQLTDTDKEALHHVRELIREHCPEYLGNDVLVKKTNLNAFKLSYGFKALFDQTPYEYYLELRFMEAKRLLLENNSVTAVAHMLEYESPTTFIKAFKKKFMYTPKQWQQRPG